MINTQIGYMQKLYEHVQNQRKADSKNRSRKQNTQTPRSFIGSTSSGSRDGSRTNITAPLNKPKTSRSNNASN